MILASEGFNYNGKAGISLATRSRTRSPVNGLGWMLYFEGTPEAINELFLQLSSDCEAEIVESGPIHKLTVRYSDDPSEATSTAASHTYELLGNSLQTDIYEHPKSLAVGEDREAIEEIQELLGTKPSDFTDEQEAAVAALLGDSLQLYNHLRQRNGSMGFQESQFVFRVTTIISRRNQYNVLFANLNKLYTFGQLKYEANPPSGYVLSLDAIASQCAPASTPSGYAWKWLKSAPTVTTAPGNRIAIQVEWQLYEWSTWVYANSASPSV